MPDEIVWGFALKYRHQYQNYELKLRPCRGILSNATSEYLHVPQSPTKKYFIPLNHQMKPMWSKARNKYNMTVCDTKKECYEKYMAAIDQEITHAEQNIATLQDEKNTIKHRYGVDDQ